VAALLDRFGLPVHHGSSLNPKAAVAQMGRDKKNRGTLIHCALPAGIGRMHRESGWTMPVPPEQMEAALLDLRGPADGI
jgi:3-dehydroquinate synthetase